MNSKTNYLLTILSLLLITSLTSYGQKRGAENISTFDDRPMHFGFYLGVNTMDYRFSHFESVYDNPVFSDPAVPELRAKAEVLYQGKSSFKADMIRYKPGFTVGGVFNLRMAEHFDFRVTPGMSLGVRELKLSNGMESVLAEDNTIADKERYKTLPSAYIDLPAGIRFKGFRAVNVRPYVYLGAAYRRDLENKRITESVVHLKRDGFYGEVAIGIDSYLPFFRLTTEAKFSYGFNNLIRHDVNPEYSNLPFYGYSISELNSNIFTLLFYFE